MKAKYIFIFGLAFIAPIVINFITGLNSPNNIAVSGTSDTWVLFFGSYIGGVLTAIIGFVAIEREKHENDKKLSITLKQKEIAVLEQTLANCVSLFDYSRVGTIALYLKDKSKYDHVLGQLDEYLEKVTTTANAWGVIYANSSKQEIRNFQDIYVDCINEMTTAINDVSANIIKLKLAENNEREQIITEITKIINNGQREYHTLLERLFGAAKQWIDSERDELERLKHS